MGTIVGPSAVIAACLLWPLGLEALALSIMGIGLRWILAVSDWVAGLEGAQGYVANPPGIRGLPVFALGVPLAGAMARTGTSGQALCRLSLRSCCGGRGIASDVLIAESGGLVGVMTDRGPGAQQGKRQRVCRLGLAGK